MNEKAAYLALHGFVACEHMADGGARFRIKQQIKDGENQLALTNRHHWMYTKAERLDGYMVIPWDRIPEVLMDGLSWRLLERLIEGTS